MFRPIRLCQRVPPDMANISPSKDSLLPFTAARSIARYSASVRRCVDCGTAMDDRVRVRELNSNQLWFFNGARLSNDGRAVDGFGILEDFALEISDHHAVVIVTEHIPGIDRHFAATAGRIDHILRDCVSCGVPAQL